MNISLRDFVRSRVNDRCEYCRLPQSAIPFVTFHIEHVVACQHGGPTDEDNLALSCDRGNAFKGTNLTAIDPLTHQIVRLFNPRTQIWAEHFRYIGYQIEGTSDCGRATTRLLNMNAPRRVELRKALDISLG